MAGRRLKAHNKRVQFLCHYCAAKPGGAILRPSWGNLTSATDDLDDDIEGRTAHILYEAHVGLGRR